jgi:DNA-binding response OmpR family regulator
MERVTNSNTKKVLIIEDEKAMGRAMEIKLQKEGINAHAVFSGEEGIQELESGSYTLVLLDIMMPGIDGWQVLSAIHEKSIEVKIIITSNLSQEEDKKKAKELGAIDFLVKSDASLIAIAEEVKSYL